MYKRHVYGRSNLAASAVYLMRAVGMSAFQTSLLPTHSPQHIAALNQKPFDELLNGHHFDPGEEIERAIAITRTIVNGCREARFSGCQHALLLPED